MRNIVKPRTAAREHPVPSQVGRIYDALDDLMLPYRFSLVVCDANLDPAVAAHIDRVGITVFTAPALADS